MNANLQTTRNNHFVPKGLLKYWSQDGKTIFAYRTLVSHNKVPLWQRRSIDRTASQNDLYTEIVNEGISDAHERWIQNKYENPGLLVIAKLIGGGRLDADDWRQLHRFVAVQDVRTPSDYLESMKKASTNVPKIMDETLAEIQQRYKNREPLIPEGYRLHDKDHKNQFFKELFKVKISNSDKPGISNLTLEATIGREFWIARQRQLLHGVAKELHKHKWSVVKPFSGFLWPITDHPVLKLNYYSNRKYDFGGGYGRPGTEIMMAISPQHLLYTQIGNKVSPRITLPKDVSKLIIKLLLERAYRWVYMDKPHSFVEDMRPRLVDKNRFSFEKNQWDNWHQNQLKVCE